MSSSRFTPQRRPVSRGIPVRCRTRPRRVGSRSKERAVFGPPCRGGGQPSMPAGQQLLQPGVLTLELAQSFRLAGLHAPRTETPPSPCRLGHPRWRSTPAMSTPALSSRSPSRSFRTFCSGLCRRRFTAAILLGHSVTDQTPTSAGPLSACPSPRRRLTSPAPNASSSPRAPSAATRRLSHRCHDLALTDRPRAADPDRPVTSGWKWPVTAFNCWRYRAARPTPGSWGHRR